MVGTIRMAKLSRRQNSFTQYNEDGYYNTANTPQITSHVLIKVTFSFVLVHWLVHVYVCLFVNRITQKGYGQIFMTRNSTLHFNGD